MGQQPASVGRGEQAAFDLAGVQGAGGDEVVELRSQRE
jgi:hypothetical protein